MMDRLVIMESFICGLVSSATDIDHFVAAENHFSLESATSLSSRPWMHRSSLALLVCVIVLLVSLLYGIWWMHSLSFMLLMAWSSHHLRDGLRRGISFYPFESSPAIDYRLYILVILLLPIVVSYLFDLTGALVLTTKHDESLNFKKRRRNISLKESSETLLSGMNE